MELEVEAANGHRGGQSPVLPPVASFQQHGDERAMLQQFLTELNVYYTAVKLFAEQEPDHVLQQVAAYSARLVEIRATLHRSTSALAQKLRTKEVDPLLEHLDFQFRIASRQQSIREHDFKASGGGV